MIAILKIDSADIINEFQSDTLALCLIPSNRIKYKLSELPILKEIINQNVDVEEKTDPPDPDKYIFIDDVPEYFWKFIKYALSKPNKISPDSYEKLCELMQANTSRTNFNNLTRIFNWATFSNLINSMPDYPIITTNTNDDYPGYIFQGETSVISDQKFSLRNNAITISAEVQLASYVNKSENIVIYQPVTNYLNPNYWFRIIKTGYKNIQLSGRTSTVSANTFSLNLDLDYTDGDAQYIAYSPITITATCTPTNATTARISLQVDYYNNKPSKGIIKTQSNYNAVNLSAIPSTEVQERIGGYKTYKTTSAGITNIDTIRKFRKFQTTIQNITTKEKTQITYIDYDKSKAINEKLLMIV